MWGSQYLEKGFIKEVTDIADREQKDCQGKGIFSRCSTKLRLVFDAASRNKQGKSLIGEIAKGPNRINGLYQILLSSIQYHRAVQADISEKFLQIEM